MKDFYNIKDTSVKNIANTHFSIFVNGFSNFCLKKHSPSH